MMLALTVSFMLYSGHLARIALRQKLPRISYQQVGDYHPRTTTTIFYKKPTWNKSEIGPWAV